MWLLFARVANGHPATGVANAVLKRANSHSDVKGPAGKEVKMLLIKAPALSRLGVIEITVAAVIFVPRLSLSRDTI
jgi:hypothetical protein